METYPPRTLEQVQAQRQKQQRALAVKNNHQTAAAAKPAAVASKKNGSKTERADGRALTQMRPTCQFDHSRPWLLTLGGWADAHMRACCLFVFSPASRSDYRGGRFSLRRAPGHKSHLRNVSPRSLRIKSA
jgi:hypothetical protein